jgi:hypothetical protein
MMAKPARQIFLHDHDHSCIPELQALVGTAEVMRYGIAAQCGCGQVWVCRDSKPWLRRSHVIGGGAGWWVRETFVQAARRRRWTDSPVQAALRVEARK